MYFYYPEMYSSCSVNVVTLATSNHEPFDVDSEDPIDKNQKTEAGPSKQPITEPPPDQSTANQKPGFLNARSK